MFRFSLCHIRAWISQDLLRYVGVSGSRMLTAGHVACEVGPLWLDLFVKHILQMLNLILGILLLWFSDLSVIYPSHLSHSDPYTCPFFHFSTNLLGKTISLLALFISHSLYQLDQLINVIHITCWWFYRCGWLLFVVAAAIDRGHSLFCIETPQMALTIVWFINSLSFRFLFHNGATDGNTFQGSGNCILKQRCQNC